MEKPFGHDQASARALAAELHQYIDESQLFRIDHYLGKMGLDEILHLRFANTILEPVWNRNYVECVQINDGRELRRRGPGPLLRPRRRAARRRGQPPDAGAWPRPRWSRPSRGDPKTLKDAQVALFRAGRRGRPGPLRARSVRRLPRHRRAWPPDSATETYAAMRLEIENWRWSGVPFFIRTGKRLPVTQTELRVVFKRPPKLGLRRHGDRTTEANQVVVKLDPSTGVRVESWTRGGPTIAAVGSDRRSTWSSPTQGGEGATPYEVLLHAALRGDSTRFTRQDGVEETWRVMQPLLDAPPPVHTYAPGSWGPAEADAADGGARRLAQPVDVVMSDAEPQPMQLHDVLPTDQVFDDLPST